MARLAEAVFWLVTPIVFLLLILGPTTPVIYVGDRRFSIEIDTVRSLLSWPVGDVVYCYPVTLMAIALAMPMVAVRRRCSLLGTEPIWIPSCFLPAYLWGLEATKHLLWTMRCLMEPPDPITVVHSAMAVCGFALALTLACGGGSAILLGRRPGFGTFAPAPICAIIASVTLLWLAPWAMLSPAAGSGGAR